MHVPKLSELEKIWDVAPAPYKPRINATGEKMPLPLGPDVRREKKLPRAIVGETPAVYVCDWISDDEVSWGVMVLEVKDEPVSHLLVSDLWLQEPIKNQGLMSELARRGYPYWRKHLDYWCIPLWNTHSRDLFEHIGFRESDLIPGTYGPTSLVADLKDNNGPMAKWYKTKEPSEADPADE